MSSSGMYELYEAVIGLEVHCQLDTNSKIFASDPNQFGSEPNMNVGVITLAHPGTLPKLNEKAVEFAVKMGLACGCRINQKTYFDRKNYFYPDLPKGYQVSQDKYPICLDGGVTISLGKQKSEKFLAFHHIHLEEDAGKSIHDGSATETLLDYNRAGTPLIEIVSEPCMRSGEEAAAYLTEIRQLVKHLGICDGNMEEGSMRCDLNISVRKKGETHLGVKVEIKNMNSMRNIQRAADYEFKRQVDAIEKGETLIQETRGYDADKNLTYSMRVKESMNDYRYFPEPDLAPIVLSDSYLAEIKASIPALPRELVQKYTQQLGLSAFDAAQITESPESIAYFEESIKHTTNAKAVANWMISVFKGHMNETGVDYKNWSILPVKLAEIIGLIDAGTISNSTASQKLFPALLENPNAAALTLCEQNNWVQQSNTDTLQALVDDVLAAMPDKVKEYNNGKKGLLGLFVGEVMKRSKGSADPKTTNELIIKTLGK